MTFHVILATDEDGWIVAECPALPGCVAQGRTRAEALEEIQDAIEGILAVRRKHGLPMPEEIAVEVAV